MLVLSEVASLLGKPLAPLLPPWGTGLACRALRLLGVRPAARDAPASCATAAGSTTASSRPRELPLRHTTRETVQAFAEHLRVAPLKRDGAAPYRYEREVEEFLRCSPCVRRDESGS